MLHITKIKNLFFQLLFACHQFLSFLVQLALNLIQIGIQAGYWVSQVNDLLILRHQLSFIIAHIILKNGFVRHFISFVFCCILQSFDQFFFVLIKVLNQRLQSLNLLLQVSSSLILISQFSLTYGQISSCFLVLIPQDLYLLLQIEQFNLMLILLVLGLDRFWLSGMKLGV